MKKKFDTLVFIGRFQPVHVAHLAIIEQAASLADQLIIIVGSARQPRTYKNPFTSAERESMISDVILGSDRLSQSGCSIHVAHNTDSMYNDQAWASRVQEIVQNLTSPGDNVGIIGYEKDESSFYLRMFPQWKFQDVGLIEPLDATNVRDLYFRKGANMKFLESVLPGEVAHFFTEFMQTPEYEQIIAEREFVAKYKKQFEGLAYPPVFVTADAVVICSGHVLMIKRRAEPGKGLWALPGGFLDVNTDKSVKDAAVRELKEETSIKLPTQMLYGCIEDSKVFDAINRSARGRTITHAFKFILPDGELPKVKGTDDAEKAQWVPIAAVQPEDCFEDHYDIISHFVGK